MRPCFCATRLFSGCHWPSKGLLHFGVPEVQWALLTYQMNLVANETRMQSVLKSGCVGLCRVLCMARLMWVWQQRANNISCLPYLARRYAIPRGMLKPCEKCQTAQLNLAVLAAFVTASCGVNTCLVNHCILWGRFLLRHAIFVFLICSWIDVICLPLFWYFPT